MCSIHRYRVDPELGMRQDNGSNRGSPRRSEWLVHKVLSVVRVRPEARMGSLGGQRQENNPEVQEESLTVGAECSCDGLKST